MLNEWQGFLVVVLFCAAVVATALIWRAFRGNGSVPLSPLAAASHRGRTVGIVEECVRGDHVTVLYQVGGETHRVTEGIREMERALTESDLTGPNPTGAVVRRYTATNLGDLCLGGEIRVRYRLDDPADAVLVPNGHNPWSRDNDLPTEP